VIFGDIEFTVQEGRLHVLQVRIGKRTATLRRGSPWKWRARGNA
jgi:hypothetical protein